jgi:hypothetical protein
MLAEPNAPTLPTTDALAKAVAFATGVINLVAFAVIVATPLIEEATLCSIPPFWVMVAMPVREDVALSSVLPTEVRDATPVMLAVTPLWTRLTAEMVASPLRGDDTPIVFCGVAAILPTPESDVFAPAMS